MMMDLDVECFWADDELAHKENCFSKEAPQVALGIRMSNECVFAELGEEGNPWGYTPLARRIELNKRYNEKAVKIVGRPLLKEIFDPDDAIFPAFKKIGTIFGGVYEFDGNTEWLKPTLQEPRDLEKKLDEIEKMDVFAIRDFIMPSNWDSEKKRIFETYGKRPPLFDKIRGPVTLADSVFGAENMMFLIYDAPELAVRFSNTIADVICKYCDIFIEEAGYTQEKFPHRFSFNDDDCALMTPDMYELFAAPILEKVFNKMAPNSGDWRYQHSDSAMEHIVPILARFNLSGCNFGPTVTVSYIRKYMKNTRIDGQLAPFTFMSNDEANISTEVIRDCEMAREGDLRGLNLKTAGSINNGSLLTSMRCVMATIQNYGRY